MQMNINRFFILVLAVCGLLFPVNFAAASEPRRPDVNRAFDATKEQKIDRVSRHASEDAFENLKDMDFLLDEELLNKAIYKTFAHRKEEGLALSMRKLDIRKREFAQGKDMARARDVHLAKKILEVFPDESIPMLLDLYRNGDATTKGNIIRVSGRLAGESPRNLLIQALDDKTVCEPEDPEVDGPPMRVCDVAYNQLVLRYRIKNVLRTIGPVYGIESRDFHIAILKGKL